MEKLCAWIFAGAVMRKKKILLVWFVCVCSRICASCFAKYLGLQCLGISHVSLTYEFPVLSRAEFQVSKTLTQIICRPISVLYAHAVKE